MNYYYNLPQDIITLIEDKVKEELIKEEEELIKKSLNEWKIKMRLVNKIFECGCYFGDDYNANMIYYADMIEQGMTYREMIEQFDYLDYDGKFIINNAEVEFIDSDSEED